jgi:hypothetical protein
MKQKDKNIDIQGLEKPSSSFTSNVMKGIDAEELALSNIILRHGMVSPSPEFTAQLMPQLIPAALTEYKPVISKSFWVGLAAILVTLIMWTLTSGTENSNALLVGEGLSHMSESFVHLLTTSTLIKYVLISVLGVSMLLVIEQRFSYRSLMA